MNASPQNDETQVRGPSQLWIGLLPPLGWVVCLLVNYMLVPQVCAT